MYSYPILESKLHPVFDITNDLIMTILAQLSRCAWKRMAVYESAHLLTYYLMSNVTDLYCF